MLDGASSTKRFLRSRPRRWCSSPPRPLAASSLLFLLPPEVAEHRRCGLRVRRMEPLLCGDDVRTGARRSAVQSPRSRNGQGGSPGGYAYAREYIFHGKAVGIGRARWRSWVAGGVQGQLSSGRKMKQFSRMITAKFVPIQLDGPENNPPPRFMFGEASWNPWCCPSCTMVAGLWGISMDIEQSGGSGRQVLCPRSSSTHPHVRLLTSQLFAKVGCFGLAGMCASMVWSCGLLARREKQRKVLPLHRFYYSHASCLAMSFFHTCASTTTLTVPCRTWYSFGGLFYHLFHGAKCPTGSALLQSFLELQHAIRF